MNETKKSRHWFQRISINFRDSASARKSIKLLIAYLFSLLAIVVVYGAIPFVSIPSLLQIVWVSGFAESFVNAGFLATKAINFGLPNKAPMAIGSAGAFLQSIFIWLFHVNAADAYSLMSLVWLALALWGAIKLCQALGSSFITGSFLSLIYLTLPVVWWHAEYSLLSFGFALLPLYIYMSIKIIYFPKMPNRGNFSFRFLLPIIGFIITSFISVFLDGYTFVMFFSAAGLIWFIAFIRKDISRRISLLYSLPVLLLSALLSYFAYTKYLGFSEFAQSSINFFRGWGVDIIMLLVPSKGVSWLWDLLHVSQQRSNAQFFGDASVWLTTFALPIIVIGVTGFTLSKKNRFALPMLLVAIFGFYFSLGPSLKFNSLRPVDAKGVALVNGSSMPANLAIMPTGSAFISENIPGFINMRAAYRWSGLMFVGLFGLSVLFYLALSSHGHLLKVLAIFGVLFLIVSNLPDVQKRLTIAIKDRNSVSQINTDLVEPMKKTIGEGKIVFFAPPSNDFVINYLASMGKFYTYNVGGDKNVEMARQNWPEPLLAFAQGNIGERFNQNIERVLQSGVADVVVLTYFDTLNDVYSWPPNNTRIEAMQLKFSPTLNYFETNPQYKIDEERYYAGISLASPNKKQAVSDIPALDINQALNLSDMNCEQLFIFGRCWYQNEGNFIWSSNSDDLSFRVLDDCLHGNTCSLALTMNVYNASALKPKTVQVEIDRNKQEP